MLIVIDLTGEPNEQFSAAERTLQHLAQHAPASMPRLLVGGKAEDTSRLIPAVRAWQFARENNLSYVECDCLQSSCEEVLLLACLMGTTGHEALYQPEIQRSRCAHATTQQN